MPSPLITEIQIRSAVTEQGRGSYGTPGEYTINPYRGCQFGCSYCYASKFVYEDAAKKADWGHWVEVKKNVVETLARESHKLFGKRIWLGSATDPYQPLELRLGLTRALLEVLLMAYPARLHIQTRSPHIVHDIDLLQRFGDTVTVGISIPTDSEVVRRLFEPRAPSIPRRLKTAAELKAAGIRVSASIAPLLPCTPERLVRMLQPVCHTAWVGTIQFYDKADPLRRLYDERGWGRYLHRDHLAAVQTALIAAGLSSKGMITDAKEV